MKKFDELDKSYKEKQKIWKISIRLDTNKVRRFFKWVVFYAIYPFTWLWVNIRDFKTFIIFGIVFLVVSSEVWIPYLLGAIFYSNVAFRITMFSVGSACLLFWNVIPCTPFLGICIGITIGIKALFNKIKLSKKKIKV